MGLHSSQREREDDDDGREPRRRCSLHDLSSEEVVINDSFPCQDNIKVINCANMLKRSALMPSQFSHASLDKLSLRR